MGRAVTILGGILVLTVAAGGLTEATLALGHHGRLSDDLALRARQTGIVATPTPMPTPTAVLAPSASPLVATPTPSPQTSGPVAVTNSYVRLRADKSTSSAILAELNGGTRVELLADQDAQWQQVRYDGSVGYIFRSYLSY